MDISTYLKRRPTVGMQREDKLQTYGEKVIYIFCDGFYVLLFEVGRYVLWE